MRPLAGDSGEYPQWKKDQTDFWYRRGEDVTDNTVKGEAKDKLVSELSTRTGIDYDNMNDFIKQWADTSNDNAYGALEMQKVSAKMYGSELSEFQIGKLKEVMKLRSKGGTLTSKNLSVFESKLGKLKSGVPFKTSEDAVEASLKAMYEYTQEEFAKQGIDKVFLSRGTTTAYMDDASRALVKEAANTLDPIEVGSNALESWTIDIETAEQFAISNEYGAVIQSEVPIDRIIGMSRTGFGCLDEFEFVVIGGGKSDVVTIAQALW